MDKYPSIQAFSGDTGYRGTAVEYVDKELDMTLHISEKIEGKWAVLPKRLDCRTHIDLVEQLSPIYLKGVKVIIAESYERIHRNNLIGMGILPLQFIESHSAPSLGLTGSKAFTVEIADSLAPQQNVTIL